VLSCAIDVGELNKNKGVRNSARTLLAVTEHREDEETGYRFAA